MKNLKSVLVLVAAVVVATLSSSKADEALSFQRSTAWISAGGTPIVWTNKVAPRILGRMDTSRVADAEVELVPYLGPAMIAAPSWKLSSSKITGDFWSPSGLHYGGWPQEWRLGSYLITGDEDIPWWSMVSSGPKLTSWAGYADPPQVFQDEHGLIRTYFVNVRSLSGLDTVSLAGIGVHQIAGDLSGGIMIDPGQVYTDLAVGQTAAGKFIQSGSAGQWCRKVSVMAQLPTYIIGKGSESRIAKGLVLGQIPSIQASAWYGEARVTVTVGLNDELLATPAPAPTPVGPILKIASSGSGPMLSMVPVPGMEDRSYSIEISDGPNGPWTIIGGLTLSSGQTRTLPTTAQHAFYRLVSPE
jgi:hypothetical protein